MIKFCTRGGGRCYFKYILSNEIQTMFSKVLTDVIWVKNCRSKKGLKQCLGGLKCSQNTKKNKKTLKVSFKAIFNVHFANLVSKEHFSIQRLIIFLLYE